MSTAARDWRENRSVRLRRIASRCLLGAAAAPGRPRRSFQRPGRTASSAHRRRTRRRPGRKCAGVGGAFGVVAAGGDRGVGAHRHRRRTTAVGARGRAAAVRVGGQRPARVADPLLAAAHRIAVGPADRTAEPPRPRDPASNEQSRCRWHCWWSSRRCHRSSGRSSCCIAQREPGVPAGRCRRAAAALSFDLGRAVLPARRTAAGARRRRHPRDP